RDGKDHGRLPAHRSLQRSVGSRVAGVKRYHEIGHIDALVARDVADLEPQSLAPEPACELAAGCNDVLLEVEPHEIDLTTMNHRQEMMQSERQIRLAGSEVDDA